MTTILIPVTNHATLGSTDEANGTYAPELTHALAVFIKAGFTFQIASIKGGAVPIYGEDVEGDDVNAEVLAEEVAKAQLQNSVPLSGIDIAQYDAIFYPGGFGLLGDLAENSGFASLAASLYENKGIIGAVCHGPAALLPITLQNGEPLLADKCVTGFTREEEIDFGTISKIPFLLEESLARKAKGYSKVQPWLENIVVDQRLVTGQNPASAHGVATNMVSMLSQ